MPRLSNQELAVLVGKAQRGDAAAVEEIITELEPEIKREVACSGIYIPGNEREDLEQNARIVVFKAIRQFDGSKGNTNFRHFALKVCVHRDLLSGLNAANRKRMSILNNGVSLDVPLTSPDGDVHETTMYDSIPDEDTDTEGEFLIHEEADELHSALLPQLTELERSSYERYIDRQSYREIAMELDQTEKAVDNALMRVRSKAKKIAADMDLEWLDDIDREENE